MKKTKKKILIVGAGFSGAVLAREIAKKNITVDVIEKKNHVAGNCFTKRDAKTNIMEHVYGPHIFNTSNKIVWDYIRQFGKFIPFIHRVKAVNEKGIFSFPINLHTINQFFNKKFNPSQAKKFIKKISLKIKKPKNLEEQALSMIGVKLYKSFFYGYTKKQWGIEPGKLPASILKRIPIRFNYNDNYYNKKYTGIPKDGYTKIIKNILNHKYINVFLKKNWSNSMLNKYDHIFFSGEIDKFFNYKYGKLGYRTVFWKKNTYLGDFQGCAGINYTSENDLFTRIYEHKHLTPWENHKKTIVFKEYSKKTEKKDIAFYPIRLPDDKKKLSRYIIDSKKIKKITFIGRLGTYRYLDMEDVIFESLKISKKFIKNLLN
jgi:UDP-galactopyranose mutase